MRQLVDVVNLSFFSEGGPYRRVRLSAGSGGPDDPPNQSGEGHDNEVTVPAAHVVIQLQFRIETWASVPAPQGENSPDQRPSMT
jgi:hypothetical protein